MNKDNWKVSQLIFGRLLIQMGPSHDGKIYHDLAKSIQTRSNLPLEAVDGDMLEFVLALCDAANEYDAYNRNTIDST